MRRPTLSTSPTCSKGGLGHGLGDQRRHLQRRHQCRLRSDSRSVTVGFGPVGIAFEARNRSIVVTNIEDTSVSVIDAGTCNAIISFGCTGTQPKLAVGRAPLAVAIDPTVGTIYTSNGDNTVSIAPTIR